MVSDPGTYSRPTGSVRRRKSRVGTNARNWFDTSDPSASSRGASVHVNARICRRGCVKGQGYLATWLPGYLARLGAVAVVAVDVFCRVVTTAITPWPHDLIPALAKPVRHDLRPSGNGRDVDARVHAPRGVE